MHPNLKDVGYAAHTDLVNELNYMNIKPIFVDSKTILINPKLALNHLCDLLQIPFEENMLKWKMGGRIEDGIWAKYWYKNIHKSAGYKKYKAKKVFYKYARNSPKTVTRFLYLLLSK